METTTTQNKTAAMCELFSQSKPSKAEIALALGYKKLDTLAVRRAHAILRPGETIIGKIRGTGRYLGLRKQNRVRRQFPAMTRLEVLAYGRSQGDDLIAVIGPVQSVH